MSRIKQVVSGAEESGVCIACLSSDVYQVLSLTDEVEDVVCLMLISKV
jgi:hypothetical protein